MEERTRTEQNGVGSSKVRAGSSITDELRTGGIYRPASNRRYFTEEELTAIADRIDEQYYRTCKALDSAWSATSHEVLEQAIDGLSDEWVKLPVDSDGVPIHVGDTIEIEHNGRVTTVTNINYNEYGWQVYCSEGGGFDKDTRCRHYHEPTVEDVLREFAYGLGVPVADSYVAATAAKLRLAEEDE